MTTTTTSPFSIETTVDTVSARPRRLVWRALGGVLFAGALAGGIAGGVAAGQGPSAAPRSVWSTPTSGQAGGPLGIQAIAAGAGAGAGTSGTTGAAGTVGADQQKDPNAGNASACTKSGGTWRKFITVFGCMTRSGDIVVWNGAGQSVAICGLVGPGKWVCV